MVKYLLSFAMVFSVCLLNAQTLPDFNTPQNKLCPLDTNVAIRGFTGWEAYQTLDDTWNGPRDSASCFNYAPLNGNYKAIIKFKDIDTSKAVFVRALFNPVLLNSNSLYNVNSYFSPSGNDVLTISDTCIEGLCSGFRLGIAVPDSAGTGQNYRWYGANNNNGFCMSTEYFGNANFVSEIMYRFQYKGNGVNDSVIMYAPTLEYYYNFEPIFGPLTATPHAGGRYQYRFDERPDYNGFGPYAFLFMYNVANGYPSQNNLYYMEVVPDPNPPIVDTLDVVMAESQWDQRNYIFQPFTRLHGAHPDGDSVNRHVVNIINKGASLCLNIAYEKGFEKGAKYEHHAGEVHFNDGGSCFLFGEGGKLVVADGASFLYGNNGRGMMALKSGSTIEIGKGAELLVGGHITMFEYEWETQSNQIYMDLNEGSKLTFLPGSRLSNMKSVFGQIKLNINMKGGTLDDSGLSPEDKRLINLIYPAPKRYLEDNVTILPNPVDGQLRLSYNTKAKTELLLTVVDLNGKTVYTTTKQAFEGMNFIETEYLNLPAGAYILRVQSGGQVAVKRFALL